MAFRENRKAEGGRLAATFVPVWRVLSEGKEGIQIIPIRRCVMTTFSPSAASSEVSGQLADKVEMQHRLFAEISAMFGSEGRP